MIQRAVFSSAPSRPIVKEIAFYTRQHLNLDIDLPPSRKQLVLLNKDEVDAAVAAAEAATVEAMRKNGHLAE